MFTVTTPLLAPHQHFTGFRLPGTVVGLEREGLEGVIGLEGLERVSLEGVGLECLEVVGLEG